MKASNYRRANRPEFLDFLQKLRGENSKEAEKQLKDKEQLRREIELALMELGVTKNLGKYKHAIETIIFCYYNPFKLEEVQLDELFVEITYTLKIAKTAISKNLKNLIDEVWGNAKKQKIGEYLGKHILIKNWTPTKPEFLMAMVLFLRGENKPIEVNTTEEEKKLNKWIEKILCELGITDNFFGYIYILDTLKIAYKNPNALCSMLNELYSAVGKKYSTRAEKVKSYMRVANFKIWECAPKEAIRKYLGEIIANGLSKPSDGEVMANIIDFMIIEAYEFKGDLTSQEKLKLNISKILRELGMFRNHLGYNYVAETIVIMHDDSKIPIRQIYAKVAESHKKQLESVERDIYYIVHKMWRYAPEANRYKYFGEMASQTDVPLIKDIIWQIVKFLNCIS